MPSVTPPTTDTARRLEWRFLPAHLRRLVEERCGAPVVRAVSCTRGFTPGFASVLECEDGSRHFVKAASTRAQPAFAAAYREEARKLAALPPGAPAPRLLWTLDDDWVVLGIEYVDVRHPARPWRSGDLDRCLDALEQLAELPPSPEGLTLDTFEEEFAPFARTWDTVRERRPGLRHADEAAALAATYGEVTGGQALVHTDVRDDNLLLDPTGRVWLCDWNWPVLGAAWLDSLLLLIGPRGDGLDVEEVVARRRLLRDVPDRAVDVVLALVTGYFLKSADDPVLPTSPRLRDHQRWQGEVCWDWLCDRRGWS